MLIDTINDRVVYNYKDRIVIKVIFEYSKFIKSE